MNRSSNRLVLRPRSRLVLVLVHGSHARFGYLGGFHEPPSPRPLLSDGRGGDTELRSIAPMLRESETSFY